MSTVQLIVGSYTFSISAELLSKESDYFKALLHSGMQESITRQVSLPDFDKKTMEFILTFVEDGTFVDFDMSNVEQVMEVYYRTLLCGEYLHQCSCSFPERSVGHSTKLLATLTQPG